MSRRKILAGTTSLMLPIFVQDTTSTTGAGLGSLVFNTAGVAAKYRRAGDNTWTSISLVTATVGTFASGGFVADGGPVTGGYEVGVPNAVIAAGVSWAQMEIYGAANMLPVLIEFELDAVNYQDAVRFGLSALPNATAGASGGLPTLDADLTIGTKLKGILTTLLTEGATGRIAAAFQAAWNVASPVWTAASVNQSGDGFARLGAPAGASIAADVAAILAAVQNVQNNTFVSTSIPMTLERPDSSSTSVSISIVFSDETGAAKNLDSGNPTVTLVNDAGADKSGRLGAFSNPASGKYVVVYTNTSTDTLEGLHWDVTGTINGKLRRLPAYTQLVDTTAVDFTSTDRTNLNSIVAKLPSSNIADETLVLAAVGSPMQAGAHVQLATSQDQYAPSKAGDQMDLVNAPNALAVAALQSGLAIAGDAMTLTTGERNAVADALLDRADAIETGLTVRQAHRLEAAAAAGELSGAETSQVEISNAVAGSKVRITADVDDDGNRSNIVTDLT